MNSNPEVPVLLSPETPPIKKQRLSPVFYENIWRNITFVIIPLSLFLMYYVVLFQIWAAKNLTERAKASDFWMAAAAALLIHGIRRLFHYLLYPSVYQIIDPKHKGPERVERTKKVSKWIYDTCYYGYMTFFVYHMMGDAYFLPPLLGGQGSCANLFIDYPALPSVPQMQIYYLVQLGSHLCSVFEQLLLKKNDVKFYEYFLHHYLAFILIFYSYYLHEWAFGALVMIIHDISDVFLSFARAVDGQKYLKGNKWMMYLILGTAANSWAYLRVIVFPACPIYASTVAWGQWTELWPTIKYPYMFQYFLMLVLLVMNAYWVAILMSILVKSCKKKALANDYDPNVLKNTQQ
jgi:ceramide synthetase